MADAFYDDDYDSDEISEGSDLEIDSGDEYNYFMTDRRKNENYEHDEWLAQMIEESNDTELEGFEHDWEYDKLSTRVPNLYTEQAGPIFSLPKESQPLDYFDKFWGEEMWQHIVTETNRYAQQEQDKNPPSPSAPNWSPITVPIMKKFVGICMLMGIVRLPSKKYYWSKEDSFLAKDFGDLMSKDRFYQIWRYLHLSNNEDPLPEQPDKLHTLRWFFGHMSEKFRSMYTCNGSVAIDESVLKIRGRLSHRSDAWGVKVWVLAEGETGYMMDFDVYADKTEDEMKGFTVQAVSDLLQNYNHKNLKVYLDKIYTTVPFFKELHTRGIQACGIVDKGMKGLPEQIIPKKGKFANHEYRVAQKDELSACTFRDYKPFMMLSNFHDPTQTGKVKRERQQVVVPSMVADFEKQMNGVNWCCQMIGTNFCHFHLFDTVKILY